MTTFPLWTTQISAARAAARAGDPPIAWVTSASLKASQKFQTQFVELHVDISIAHNIEFHSARRCARGGARARW